MQFRQDLQRLIRSTAKTQGLAFTHRASDMQGHHAHQAHQLLTLEDASEAALAQAWVPIHYCQVAAGRFAGTIETLALPGIELFHEHYTQDVCKAGALPAGQCTLSFVYTGHESMRFSQFVAADEVQSFFQPERHEFDIVVPAGIRTTYAHLQVEALLAELASLNAPLAERLLDCNSLQSMGLAGKAQLRGAMEAILDSARHPDQVGDAQALSDSVREQLVLSLNAAGDPACGSAPNLHGRRRAWVIARQAREYIEAEVQRGRPPRLVDICRAIKVSERTLRNAFLDQFGRPPSAFIRLRRLNGARASLLAASSEDKVSDIATHWGFLQFGRFAYDYRALFGESPSATLARHRPDRLVPDHRH